MLTEEVYLDIVADYLLGDKYREIEKKYNVNRWDIECALRYIGIKTNRKKIPPRPGDKYERKYSKELKAKQKENTRVNDEYFQKKQIVPIGMGNQKDNNPVLKDDLDIMERDQEDNWFDRIDDPNLRYEIKITDEGEVKYTK